MKNIQHENLTNMVPLADCHIETKWYTHHKFVIKHLKIGSNPYLQFTQFSTAGDKFWLKEMSAV